MECGSKMEYLVESSLTFKVESLCECQVFRQLFMVLGKSETGHVSECSSSSRGCQPGGHENLPSAGLWAPTVIQAGSRPQSKAVPAFQSTFCTGAANAEKDARLHQTTPISMTAEVSNTLSIIKSHHKIVFNKGFFIQPRSSD